MFATLVGTNTEPEQHVDVFNELVAIAERRGFVQSNRTMRVERDQVSLEGWSLELRGSETIQADFILAVTAPKVPSISPIPVKRTIDGPLFSVILMDDIYGIWREGQEFIEVKDSESVAEEFSSFLDLISSRGGSP